MVKFWIKICCVILWIILVVASWMLRAIDYDLHVNFLNVGQGDAILVTTPMKQTILIDGGQDGSVLFAGGVLQNFPLANIDIAILTHPHADHINGFLLSMERFETAKIIYGNVEKENAAYLELMALCRSETNRECLNVVEREKIRLDLGEGVILSIVGNNCPASRNQNNCSVIVLLEYGVHKILFMGDAEVDEESWLMENHREIILDVDVLKVGHHCSRTASSDEFIKVLRPRVAICSVGAGNSFGHPHSETLETFNRYGVKVLRTDINGTITLNCSRTACNFD